MSSGGRVLGEAVTFPLGKQGAGVFCGHLGFCADVMLVRFWGQTRWSFRVPSNPNCSLILILSEHKGLLVTAVLSVGRL